MKTRSINNLMNLEGRTALITGAAGYLGSNIAETLAELGASLILVDLPDADFSKVLNKLEKNYSTTNIEIKKCDLEDELSRKKLIDSLLTKSNDLNILVNNAAFAGSTNLKGWNTKFEEQSLESWRRAFEVNLTAVFHLTRDLTPLLKKSEHSSIINIASIYGINAPDYSLYEGTTMGNPSAYSASKGGLVQLTRWLASTLAPDIRVNAISPGGILRGQPEEFIKRYKDKTPLSRMGIEEDFKGITAFLASDLSSYVTGQNIIVDGGWSI